LGFSLLPSLRLHPNGKDVKKWRLDGERNEEYDGTQTKNSDR